LKGCIVEQKCKINISGRRPQEKGGKNYSIWLPSED